MTETREQILAGQPRAFVIFEGACPDCFGDIDEIGKSEKLNRFDNPIWSEFKCRDCDKVHFVEQVAGGDWATN